MTLILSNRKLWRSSIMLMMEEGGLNGCFSRLYSSSNWNMDMKKLRPIILERIKNRAKDYPVKSMIRVAENVLKARTLVIQGVSTLLQFIPVWSCKHCPEVYIGEKGHLIRTCGGYMGRPKNQEHEWIEGSLNDIIVPVKAIHLEYMFQSVIKHQERSDYDPVPAVVELCLQAGAFQNDESQFLNHLRFDTALKSFVGDASLSPHDQKFIARGTLNAWESLRSGVHKLLVYPAKVCKHCSKVHVGPSGYKAQLCGVFKYESWLKDHSWKKAKVDDLVPPQVVWFRRRQDPPLLMDEGREFYGHAPAVVDLCTKAGAVPPSKYLCMMKMQGLSAPALAKDRG